MFLNLGSNAGRYSIFGDLSALTSRLGDSRAAKAAAPAPAPSPPPATAPAATGAKPPTPRYADLLKNGVTPSQASYLEDARAEAIKAIGHFIATGETQGRDLEADSRTIALADDLLAHAPRLRTPAEERAKGARDFLAEYEDREIKAMADGIARGGKQ